MSDILEVENLRFQKGEQPLDNAPKFRLDNGRICIPQHYLSYNHNRETIENVLADIGYDPRYLLFVSEDGTVPYIQVGIVGYDNYKPQNQQPGKKIVFGRRWRVEPNLPTSEIIQTAFLAIKKAKEHELRETFKVKYQGRWTTPFNSHHDLPLLAQNADILEGTRDQSENISTLLSRVKLDGKPFKLLKAENFRDEKWLVEVIYQGNIWTMILSDLTENELLFSLMNEAIRRSDRQVEERFTYKGFARFSRKNNIGAIATFSARLRGADSDCTNSVFDQSLAQEKYDTDSSRIPQLSDSDYSNRLRKRLKTFDIKAGFVPE